MADKQLSGFRIALPSIIGVVDILFFRRYLGDFFMAAALFTEERSLSNAAGGPAARLNLVSHY